MYRRLVHTSGKAGAGICQIKVANNGYDYSPSHSLARYSLIVRSLDMYQFSLVCDSMKYCVRVQGGCELGE